MQESYQSLQKSYEVSMATVCEFAKCKAPTKKVRDKFKEQYPTGKRLINHIPLNEYVEMFADHYSKILTQGNLNNGKNLKTKHIRNNLL